MDCSYRNSVCIFGGIFSYFVKKYLSLKNMKNNVSIIKLFFSIKSDRCLCNVWSKHCFVLKHCYLSEIGSVVFSSL